MNIYFFFLTRIVINYFEMLFNSNTCCYYKIRNFINVYFSNINNLLCINICKILNLSIKYIH